VYDSIKAHIRTAQHIDTSRFDGHRVIEDSLHGVIARHWITRDGIHLNYRQSSDMHESILSIETALSHWTKTPRTDNPTQQDYKKAIHRINVWLRTTIGIVTDLMEWTVNRIDYCYNFDVLDVDSYLLMVRGLHCGKLSRVEHEHGVTWKNESRWVKFYDKGVQLGDGTSTLRFEVSNHHAAVRYMCKKWFGCARTVAEVLHPARAWYVLSRYLDELGLNSPDVYESDVLLLNRLRAVFPTQVHIALGTLHLIRSYGTEAQQYINRSTYYRWLKRFRLASLLPTPTHALPVLSLSSTFFLQQLPQNLGELPVGAATSSQKIWWEKLGLKIDPTPEMLRAYEQTQVMG
jgi:hypothetical protein